MEKDREKTCMVPVTAGDTVHLHWIGVTWQRIDESVRL